MSDVETAQTTTESHGFPSHWGRPRGERWSEERATWVKAQVCRFRGLAALEELARHDNRYLHTLRVALLMSRRTP